MTGGRLAGLAPVRHTVDGDLQDKQTEIELSAEVFILIKVEEYSECCQDGTFDVEDLKSALCRLGKDPFSGDGQK